MTVCPKCNGKRWVPYGNGGGITCTACSGSGLDSKSRRDRAIENKKRKAKIRAEKQAEIDELESALQSFTVRTNADGILKHHAEERLRQLKIWIY